MKALKVTVNFFALFSHLLKNYIPHEVLNLYACIIIKIINVKLKVKDHPFALYTEQKYFILMIE